MSHNAARDTDGVLGDVRLFANDGAEIADPLLGADGLVAGPVDDGGRHARNIEQLRHLGVDVVLVDGVEVVALLTLVWVMLGSGVGVVGGAV